jgi:outer membrane protein, multidrug efflux system
VRSCTALCVLLTAALGDAKPLTLPQLIALARENDHRVKESQAQLRFLKAKYDEARWAWLPRVNSYLAFGGPTPEARNDGLGGPPTTPASLMYDLDLGQLGVTVRAGVDAFVPIYTFGKLDALEQAGAKGVVVGEALHDRAKAEAELQMAQAYYGHSLAESGLGVLKDTSKRLADARETLERLRAEGSEQVTQMDVFKLDYYTKQVESQGIAAEAGKRVSLEAMRLLSATAPNDSLQVELETFAEPSGLLPPVDMLMATAKEARPELRALEAGVGAREREVFIRERFFFPDIGIAGFLRFAYTSNATRQLSPFAYDPFNEFNGGVALVMSYQLDFPQKAILLEQSRAELQKLLAQRDLATAGVRLEVEKAHAEVSAALQRSAAQTAAEKNAKRWAVAAFSAFELGTGDTRELVDSFTALALSSASKYQAYHDVAVGLRVLTRAVGQTVQLEVPPDRRVSPALMPAK